MEIIAMILSGLALLAAIVCLILAFQEKKRNEKRNAALLQYVDAKVREAEAKLSKEESHYRTCVSQELNKMVERIEKLEKGITPDYEQAKIAADAVNDFNKGISNILGFDPLTALQAERQKETGGSE